MRRVAGLGEIEGRYRGFLIDLWGVMHDGVVAFPAALDCLRRLRERGKPAVLFSNGPRRLAPTREALRRLGIADDLYAGLVTSGEVAFRMLRDRQDPWFAGLERAMLHLGPSRDDSVHHGLGFHKADVEEAGWVLVTGLDDEADPETLAPYEDVLRRAAERGLPMLCANPDLEVRKGGRRMLCAGAMAERYESLGGQVRWIGKPHPDVYRHALAEMGLAAEDVLAIGDSLRTDIAGARNMGMPCCWVLGGIHAGEDAGMFDEAADWMIETLSWS